MYKITISKANRTSNETFKSKTAAQAWKKLVEAQGYQVIGIKKVEG